MAETYVLDKPDNLVELFEQARAKFGSREWMGTKNKQGVYEWVTYEQAGQRIDNVRAGLAYLGVKKDESVGIISDNSVEWAVCCFATYGVGGRYVPMYKAELVKIWEYIIRDSAVKILFVADSEVLEKVKHFLGSIETLKKIILVDGKGEGSIAELEEIGKKNPVKSVHPHPDDIAGLIYTSGTTGDPKGVLLSHGNFSSNVHAAVKGMPQLDEKTRTLAFLPWAHSFGQTAELNSLIKIGGSCGFAESTLTIVDDLKLVKPTMLIAVPRIFNRVYDKVNAMIEEKGGLAKLLFNMGQESAAKLRELEKKGKSSIGAKIKYAIASKIVFSKIHLIFGGNLELCLSSSAALNPKIAEFFFNIGIPVYEAWGMTEISPAGSLNSPLFYKIGSVGRAIDKVRLVIDKSVMDDQNGRDGELVVYGPNVMKGYHNKPEATRETMTTDGGLRTGDRAYVDEDGFLYITGRIKEQFKLENGKFVHPAAMEEEIKLVPWVEQAMIFGLNKPHTVALIFPDFLVLESWAEKNGHSKDKKSLLGSREVIEMIEKSIVEKLKEGFGSYEIPKKFIFMDEGFTLENGMLTPTQKLKRRNVLQKYQAQIDALYAG